MEVIHVFSLLGKYLGTSHFKHDVNNNDVENKGRVMKYSEGGICIYMHIYTPFRKYL